MTKSESMGAILGAAWVAIMAGLAGLGVAALVIQFFWNYIARNTNHLNLQTSFGVTWAVCILAAVLILGYRILRGTA